MMDESDTHCGAASAPLKAASYGALSNPKLRPVMVTVLLATVGMFAGDTESAIGGRYLGE